jgi:hypothetical protein
MFVIPYYPSHAGDVGVEDRVTLILSDPEGLGREREREAKRGVCGKRRKKTKR